MKKNELYYPTEQQLYYLIQFNKCSKTSVHAALDVPCLFFSCLRSGHNNLPLMTNHEMTRSDSERWRVILYEDTMAHSMLSPPYPFLGVGHKIIENTCSIGGRTVSTHLL